MTTKQRKGTPAQVSRVLAEAGMERASAYKTFGRDRDGFIAMAAGQYGDNPGGTVVAFTGSASRQKADYEFALVVLKERGFRAAPWGRPGVGGTYNLEVQA